MSKNSLAAGLIVLLAGFASAANAGCSVLTPADVQKLAGAHVADIPFNSKPGAGGHCANYVDAKGHLYLGVTQLTSAAAYSAEVASVPQAVYPQRIKLAGLGDEAVLMKDGSGFLRYLVARKGAHGVVLFPFGSQPSDAILQQLAALALTR